MRAMRVINHKTMRAIIGSIAILMPIVVVLLSGYYVISILTAN